MLGQDFALRRPAAGAVMVVKGECEHWVPAVPAPAEGDLAADGWVRPWTGRSSEREDRGRDAVSGDDPAGDGVRCHGPRAAARTGVGGRGRSAYAHQRCAPHCGRPSLWGGPGMVMKPEPLCAAIAAARARVPAGSRRIYLSAQAGGLTRRSAGELRHEPELVIVAGNGVEDRRR